MQAKQVAKFIFAVLAVAGISGASPPQAKAEGVKIHIGVGPSQEEQLWLMSIRPDLTPNQGKAYTYQIDTFQSTNEKIKAMDGGQLDGASASASAILFAASKGIPIKAVAVEGQESEKTSSSSFMALADADVSVQNLRGKVFGIGGYRSSFELIARTAIKNAGLDADRDVKWQVVPFPQMGDVLRDRKIDIGVFPTAFAYQERQKGGLKTVFTTVGSAHLEEELDVAFSSGFIAKNREAMKAWASDFVAVTRYLIANHRAAHQAIIDAKLVQMDPKLYLEMPAMDDLYKVPDAKPDVAMWTKLQDMFYDAGWLDKKVDISSVVDTSLLPPSP
jgi:ABC-type nitrate/sulfonate/bicarbonate transport system substrate-binding protein